MNIHKNARLTPRGRERIVRQVASGQTLEAVAEAVGAGLQDRSSRPHRLRRPTPQAVVEEVERLRRQRWTGKQIAAATGVSPATVSRVLRRLGLNKLSALEPAEPVRRYEREHPGQLIHLDIKKLGCTGYIATIGIGRGRLFCKAWRQDRARDDGQRLVLPFKDVPSSLQAPWLHTRKFERGWKTPANEPRFKVSRVTQSRSRPSSHEQGQ